MVTKNLVESVHSRIVILLDEAKRHSDSPRTIAIIEILEQLTNLNPSEVPAPPCKHEHVQQGVCQDCGGQLPSLMNPPAQQSSPAECAHANISPFGVCRDCGTCLHQFRSGDGTCHQCGDKIDVAPLAVAGPAQNGAAPEGL